MPISNRAFLFSLADWQAASSQDGSSIEGEQYLYDRVNNDFDVQSQYGRWDPGTQ
ncbi:MAG: hypothetical protein HY720_07010 [Planctomycetes bacterium]|nr:hypothetical protein [Planctomycetota bacterium]